MFEAPKIYDMVSPGLEYVHKGLEPLCNRGPRVEAYGMCLALGSEQEE